MRTHNVPTPLIHLLNLIGYQMMKRSKTYISFNKQPMEYNNATLEGQWEFLIIELLKKPLKIKKNIIYEHNLMSTVKKNNKIKFASDKI